MTSRKLRRPSAKRTKRLPPGALDGLVLGFVRKHGNELPLSPKAVARGLGRSSDAVADCLIRLAASGSVRLVSDRPRRYEIAGELMPPFERLQVDERELLILGRAVRAMRETRELGLAELAAQARLDVRLIAALELGQIDPPYDCLLALAEGLGVRPSALFLRADDLRRRWYHKRST